MSTILVRIYLSLFLIITSSTSFATDHTLNLFCWAGYMPESILKQFEKETGIKVKYSTYENNEILYAKLKANPRVGYDIVVPSTYFIDRMWQQKMLQRIDKSKISNFKNLNPVLLNKDFDPGNNYSIPYLWSATGIVVNNNYWSKGSINSWNDLWQKNIMINS